MLMKIQIGLFHANKKFYKMFNAETCLRDLASKCENVWIMALFACCRQKYVATDPKLCISFNEKDAAEVREKLEKLAAYNHEVGEVKTEETWEEQTAHLNEEEKQELAKELKRAEAGLAPKARGQPYLPSELMANLVMAWGCPPSKMVLADTRMIHDFFDTLRDGYNKKTLAVKFPDVLDHLLSEAGDACWEFWKSNELQPVKIFYECNKVTDAYGVIFYNTQLDNKHQDLQGAERRA